MYTNFVNGFETTFGVILALLAFSVCLMIVVGVIMLIIYAVGRFKFWRYLRKHR